MKGEDYNVPLPILSKNSFSGSIPQKLEVEKWRTSSLMAQCSPLTKLLFISSDYHFIKKTTFISERHFKF